MKPFINLAELDNYEELEDGPFKERFAVISERIGAKKLGYNVTIIPPGKKACPFHNHRINEEMFLVLKGEGLLRYGEVKYEIKQHDIIACPPGDRSVAHQIINSGEMELTIFCLSTNIPYEICEYPDSNKVMSKISNHDKVTFKFIAKAEKTVDYMEGEI